MTGYVIVYLDELVKELGEDRTKSILSSFSCPLNKDVETFLKQKAIEFSIQDLSKTHLVYTSYKDKPELIGYFTLANKFLKVSRSALSSNLRKRIKRFTQYDEFLKEYIFAAPLIAQLSKNYTNGFDKLITGDELLKMALDKLAVTQQIFGGKIVYLECEDNQKLIEFYMNNGFVPFYKRILDGDEEEVSKSNYYIQMIKFT